ncbi:hypothetical protein BS78_10G096700 [Paspalum vaginatum]|nr:hypothetical protein BS78_10G096700 [Paspalum vaginatum]
MRATHRAQRRRIHRHESTWGSRKRAPPRRRLLYPCSRLRRVKKSPSSFMAPPSSPQLSPIPEIQAAATRTTPSPRSKREAPSTSRPRAREDLGGRSKVAPPEALMNEILATPGAMDASGAPVWLTCCCPLLASLPSSC